MMVVNLRMQMESYSNDQLLHTLSNEQDSPAEILQIARSIVLARGLSQRNVMDRSNYLREARSEAAELLDSDKTFEEVVQVIRDKYFLEQEVAHLLVKHAPASNRLRAMFNCLRFFMVGVVLFYLIRITIAVI